MFLSQEPKAKTLTIQERPITTSYVDYSHRLFSLIGTLLIDINSNGWVKKNANLLISENRTRCLLGLDLQPDLGIMTKPLQPPNTVSKIAKSEEEIESTISKKSKERFIKDMKIRLSRSKNHKVNTLFKSPLIPI